MPDTTERIEGTFTGVGGGKIHWRAWKAAVPEAQVVIVHGYGEHGDRYKRFAERLSSEGFTVWANDHHGHGKSEGPRGVINRLDDAVADLDHVVELARAERPDLPLFMFAHSMGGTIGLTYALKNQSKLSGLVLSSAAVSLEGIPVPKIQLGLIKVLSKVAPKVAVNKLPLEGISRDPEEERIYMEDPLVHTGAQPARTIDEMLRAMTDLPVESEKLEIPLLIIAGSEDPLVPVTVSRDINEHAGSSDKTYIEYEGFVHELINEPPEDREKVTQDIVDWLSGRLG